MRGNGDDMSERHDPAAVTSISKATTLDEIADFWDQHSLDDYREQTHEAEFEVRAKRRHRVTLDPDVAERVEAEARARGILPETFVNVWLTERLQATKT
jgi:CopG antitoxin of type II toxin-antitoxin system